MLIVSKLGAKKPPLPARFAHATPVSHINGHHKQNFHPFFANAHSPTGQA